MPSYSKPWKTNIAAVLRSAVNADEGMTAVCENVTGDEDENYIRFDFDVEPSNDEKTIVDGIYDAHTGTPPTIVVWHASSVLTDHEKVVTEGNPAWVELGGSVTTPDFFTSNLPYCKGRVVGMVKTNGTGAKLRLKEDSEIPSGGYDVPDTSSEWAPMQWFAPDAPTAGTHQYALEGQLPVSGATELKVKYVAVSLLEFV